MAPVHAGLDALSQLLEGVYGGWRACMLGFLWRVGFPGRCLFSRADQRMTPLAAIRKAWNGVWCIGGLSLHVG